VNAFRIVTEQAPAYSATWSWRAVAYLNDCRTTLVCGHSHRSEALASKCAERAFADVVLPLRTALIVQAENGALEARWVAQDGQMVATRFRCAEPAR